MRIAVVSDVHGNLPALESAVIDARRNGAELILGAGDWVGYGPFPAEVVEYLRDNKISCISGNYDIKAIEAKRNPRRFSEKLRPFKWEVLDWTRRQLKKPHVTWLKKLPAKLELEPVAGIVMMVCHGFPGDNEGRVFPDITAETLDRITGGHPPRILVAGHTHIPFVRRIGDNLVINAGSTGQPVDGDTRPAYCLLEIDPGKEPSGRIIRFEYPLATLLSAIDRTQLPRWLRDDFSKGFKRK